MCHGGGALVRWIHKMEDGDISTAPANQWSMWEMVDWGSGYLHGKGVAT